DDAKKDDAKKDEPKEGPKQVEPPKEELPAQILQLGDAKLADYYILATITPRGGGVQALTRPKFQQADENGKPVFNPDGSRAPLPLIEEDFVLSSFLMYHYPVPDKDL